MICMSAQAPIGLHEKKINSLSLDLDERQLASACSDGSIAVWDVRQLKPKCRPLATARHAYTCQSAFFAPDGALWLLVNAVAYSLCHLLALELFVGVHRMRRIGNICSKVLVLMTTVGLMTCAGSQRLLSTSRDNTLRIWSRELKQLVSIPHNNNTGRWISPFRGAHESGGCAELISMCVAAA